MATGPLPKNLKIATPNRSEIVETIKRTNRSYFLHVMVMFAHFLGQKIMVIFLFMILLLLILNTLSTKDKII